MFSKKADTAENNYRSYSFEPVMLSDNNVLKAILYLKPVPYNGMFKYVDHFIVVNYDDEQQATSGFYFTPGDDFFLNKMLSRYKLRPAGGTGNQTNNLFAPDGSLYKIYSSDESKQTSLVKYDNTETDCSGFTNSRSGNRYPFNIKMIDYPFTLLNDTLSVINTNLIVSATYEKPYVYCTNSALPKVVKNNTGVNISNQLQAAIYPNPASNFITVSGLPQLPNTLLKIVNTQGLVLKKIFTSNKICGIDISSLQNGTYFLIIINENFINKTSFIKQ